MFGRFSRDSPRTPVGTTGTHRKSSALYNSDGVPRFLAGITTDSGGNGGNPRGQRAIPMGSRGDPMDSRGNGASPRRPSATAMKSFEHPHGLLWGRWEPQGAHGNDTQFPWRSTVLSSWTLVAAMVTHKHPREVYSFLTEFRGFPRESRRTPVGTAGTSVIHGDDLQSLCDPAAIPKDSRGVHGEPWFTVGQGGGYRGVTVFQLELHQFIRGFSWKAHGEWRVPMHPLEFPSEHAVTHGKPPFDTR